MRIAKNVSTIEEKWKLHPNFQDFENIEKDSASVFPKKFLVFSGNHSDLVGKIAQPRGFTKVTKRIIE